MTIKKTKIVAIKLFKFGNSDL